MAPSFSISVSLSDVLLLSKVAVYMMVGRSSDITLLIFFVLIRNWNTLHWYINAYIDFAAVTVVTKVTASLFVLLQIIRYFSCLQDKSCSLQGFPFKPLFFPCRTSHTRLFPKKHNFSYSYLLVGIPVGWEGSVGGMLSGDDSRELPPWYSRILSLNPGSAWFTVHGDDHLGRGHASGGLQEKLRNYLQSQVCGPCPRTYGCTDED